MKVTAARADLCRRISLQCTEIARMLEGMQQLAYEELAGRIEDMQPLTEDDLEELVKVRQIIAQLNRSRL